MSKDNAKDNNSIKKTNNKGDGTVLNYQEFISQNREALIHIAKTTNKYNEKGQCLISKEDEDFEHDDWEN